MEAVPKLPFISFELKVSPENTHFGPKLKQYIAEVYREDPESYGNEMHQLEGLRSAAVRPTIDDAGLKALNKYFCQLRAMQSRFPMGKGQPASCTFVWKDLYANMNCTLADLRFEMACILYNIGALHTQLASSESRSSADSLKLACQHFQNAAWAFQYLSEQYPQPSGADVSSEILKLLQEICFAQAQECILDKSRQDTRKPSVIGAVATQVLHFYKNSMAILGPSTGTDNIHEIIGTKLYNNWYRHLSFKVSYIGCIVALYQGINVEENQKMGERVAYYQLALDKLNEARKLAKYIEPVQVTQEGLTFTNDIVEGKRKAAKNENEFIYHEEVPDVDMLTEVKPVCLVKAVAINFNDPEVSGGDVFSRLVPLGAHEAASLYSERKAQLLRQVGSQADAKDLELTEFLSSLQLDQLDHLEDDDQKIPQEVVDKCAAMNANTDMITTLVDSMNSLAEVITDVEHALADIKEIIQEENEAEKEYQKSMGARPPSLVQTELARELHKYSEAHARTADSNAVLHKAMTLHIANLQLLARPLPALIETLPSIGRLPTHDRDAMREMRRVLAKADEMRAQRARLLDELRAATAADDVTALLLADPAHDRDQLFDQEIEKHTPKVKVIEQNLAAQENIINRLTSLYAAYGDSRRLLTDVLRKRDAMLNGIVTSYDSFGELVNKSAKGLEFYRKLQHNVTALLARARSVCQVQREERAQRSSAAPVVKNPTSQPAPPAATPTLTPSATPKLKDYLPYMKNRALPRNIPSQVLPDLQPSDAYPDPACPTSIRPAPVGSEATDMGQAPLPDGITSQGYSRYQPCYAPPETDTYNDKYGYNKPEEMQNYNFSGYPQQFSAAMPEQQSYVAQNQTVPISSAPLPVSGMTSYSNYELSNHFSQMNVSAPKTDVHGGEYSQTYFSVQYPHVYSDVATYSQATQDVQTSSTAFSPYAVNYPYVVSGAEYNQQLPANSNMSSSTSSYLNYSQPHNTPNAYPSVSTPAPQYQSYPVPSESSVNTSNYYPNSLNMNIYYAPDGSNHPITNQFPNTNVEQEVPRGPGEVPGPYEVPTASMYMNPTLAQMDELDRPIKSHTKGEALSTMPISSYQNFNMSAMVNYPEQVLQAGAAVSGVNPSSQYGEASEAQYGQSYQNHPGYTYNASTGNYDYSYGSQNTYVNYEHQNDVVVQQDIQSPNWQSGLYTSAGAYNTVQSPSEGQQPVTVPQVEQVDQAQQQVYYSASGQYPANDEYTSSSASLPPAPTPPAPEDNEISEPANNVTEVTPLAEPAMVAEETNESTAFDLLSDIDFSVEQKPLTPEIKIPQISEKAMIVKPMAAAKVAPTPAQAEVIVRPAKRDLFSDPTLINRFTQEVKSLQKLTESFMNKTSDGLTVLEAKWKDLQDMQDKENAKRSKRVAMERSRNKTSDVVPYDDSRLTLNSDPDAYINASFYKQLTPWCIPVVIAKCPDKTDAAMFWKAIFEKKITCIVCLLPETEMQGATYFPSQDEELHAGNVTVCLIASQVSVHWTERRLRVTCPPHAHVHTLTHLQVHVAPARLVCSSLVMLCDAVLRVCEGEAPQTAEGGACIHCDVGAGRSALLALVLAVICQVRAGQVDLADTLRWGCVEVCKGRSGALRPDVMADVYRTALFYAQGVLCSGSTMFNGEAVSVPSAIGPALAGPLLAPIAATGALVGGATAATGPLTSGLALTGPPVPTSQRNKFSRESFEEMRQAAGLKSGDMKDPLNFLDPLWTLKKK